MPRQGVGRDLALRIYTTRLLGSRPASSCCTAAATPRSRPRMPDLLGDEVEVLCVKGSGGDMATIEPAGLPAVRLEPLAQAARARCR